MEEKIRALANLVEVAFHGALARLEEPPKFELVEHETISDDGVRLWRVRALRSFGAVKAASSAGTTHRHKRIEAEGLDPRSPWSGTLQGEAEQGHEVGRSRSDGPGVRG